MKCLLPLCLLLFVFSCKQKTFYEKVTFWPGDEDIQSLDRNNGYKKLKLGRHISALLQYLKKNNESTTSGYSVYQVNPDSLAKFNIEEVKIKSIETDFQNNLLARFRVELEGEENSFPFFLLLLEAYGGTKPQDTSPETYKWNGDRVGLKYTVKRNRDATAEFTSVILMASDE